MHAERHQRVRSLFDELVNLSEDERAAMLEHLREQGGETQRQVRALLGADARIGERTARPAIRFAANGGEADWIGRRIGAFEIEREIGRGGMGRVFLAHRADGSVQQQVAIKVLGARCLDENARARFLREREILAGFEHPGIARLFDAGEGEAGEPYFVMEYLRGSSLVEHCDRKKLGVRERLRLFLEVCDAVRYAHGQLILHRDIKSSNIIVDARGVPRLIDFGIAKPLRDSGIEPDDETALPHRFFSPFNAAPEQVRGDAVAVTCDVYQLGTLLYELLCGQPLFDLRGKTAAQIEHMICEVSPRWPSDSAAFSDAAASSRGLATIGALQRTLRGDLDAITLRAVRKEPASRYASVEQLSDDVKRYLDNLPVQGRRGTTWYRLERFARRHWRSLSLGVLALMALALFTGMLILQQRSTMRERDNAVAERNRAESITQFFIDIFKSGQPSVAHGPDTPLRVVLKYGQELVEQRGEVDAQTRARLMNTLAQINGTINDLPAAEEQIVKAIAIMEAMPHADALELGDAYRSASGIAYSRSALARAGAFGEKAMAIYRAEGVGLSHTWYARLNILRALMSSDERAACDGVEALLAEIRADSSVSAQALMGASKQASFCRGDSVPDLARTETDLRDAIARYEIEYGTNYSGAYHVKLVLGGVLVAQRKFDEAAVFLQEILDKERHLFGERSSQVAMALWQLCQLEYARKDYPAAERYIVQSISLLDGLAGDGDRRELASGWHSLARILEATGREPAKVRELYTKAIDMERRIYGEKAVSTNRFIADYALFLWRSGDHAAAEPLLVTASESTARGSNLRARIALASLHLDRHALTEADRRIDLQDASTQATVAEDVELVQALERLRVAVRPTGSAQRP